MLGGCRLGVADDYLLEVALLEKRVLVAQLAGGDNLAFLQRLAVTRVYDIFLTPDTVVLVDEVALIDYLLGQEVGIAGIEDF